MTSRGLLDTVNRMALGRNEPIGNVDADPSF